MGKNIQKFFILLCAFLDATLARDQPDYPPQLPTSTIQDYNLGDKLFLNLETEISKEVSRDTLILLKKPSLDLQTNNVSYDLQPYHEQAISSELVSRIIFTTKYKYCFGLIINASGKRAIAACTDKIAFNLSGFVIFYNMETNEIIKEFECAGLNCISSDILTLGEAEYILLNRSFIEQNIKKTQLTLFKIEEENLLV